MVSRRRSTAWLLIASFGLAIATFIVGLGLAAIFDFPAKFLFTGLAVVHALEQRGVPVTNRPAIPVSFFVWWLLPFLFLVGFRSRCAKQSAA